MLVDVVCDQSSRANPRLIVCEETVHNATLLEDNCILCAKDKYRTVERIERTVLSDVFPCSK